MMKLIAWMIALMKLESQGEVNCTKEMKWHGIVVSMSAYGPDNPRSNPRLARVLNDMIFFLGVL